MSTTTTAEPIRIDPDATYTAATLAAALGVSDRQLRRWRDDRRMRFPRPFFQGRTPCWRGHAVVTWQDNRQRRVPNLGERPGQAPRCRSLEQPAPAVTAKGNGARLAAVHVVKHYGDTGQRPGSGMEEPLATVTAADHNAIAAVHLTQFHGEKGGEVRGQAADEPLRTLDTQPRFGPAAAFLSHFYTSNTCGGEGDPARPAKTVTSGGQHATVAAAFVAPYYGSGSGFTGHAGDAALPTVTAKDRWCIVAVERGGWPLTARQLKRARELARWAVRHLGAKAVDPHTLWVADGRGGRYRLLKLSNVPGGGDCLLIDLAMRMFRPRELARAQGFPDWYVIDRTAQGRRLSKDDQVMLIGNSVPPQFAEAIAYENVVKAGVLDAPAAAAVEVA